MLRRPFIALLTVTALATAVAGCGNDGSAAGSSTDKIKVGVIPIVDVAPIYLGDARGFFAKRNIELTMEQAQGGAAIVPAVISGQYQFGLSNVVSLMLAESRNVPIRMVANGNNATGDPEKDFGMIVVKDPAIRSPKDLVGRTIAANTLLNITDTAVKEIIRKDGGDPTKVKFAEIGFPDMAAALDGDRVQAIFVVEPFLAAAQAKGWRTIGALADVDPNLCVSTYFTSQQVIQTNPDLVSRFTAAMRESLAYAQANPDAVRQIVTTYTSIKEDVAGKMTLPQYRPEIDRASVDKLNKLMVTDGLLVAPVDLDNLLP
ncbi:ABC transporter substrate-binding protein [Actinoplanes sp. CA-142083]|uniref:ABC transporter substrate-binding protein n=1 Tax=Actinoplanes sp. CA-142083 TaxID=3239903 RepID=UPI003D93F1D0